MTSFTVDGKTFDLVKVDAWSVPEARVAKAVSGGMAPLEITQRAVLADPDALRALALVSIRRLDPHATEAMLDGKNLVELYDEIFQEDDAGPPDVSPSPLGTGTSDVTGSAPETTPGSSGTPDFSSTSTSDPGTLTEALPATEPTR